MHRRPVRQWWMGCVGVMLVVLVALAGAAAVPGSHAARAQAPTPGPRLTATPVRPEPRDPSVPDVNAIVGALPECSFRTSLRASHSVVTAGNPVTLTVTTDVSCPRLLDDRAAVLVVGSRTERAIADVRSSLALLVAQLATGARTRLAIIEVGADSGPTHWASTPAAIAAQEARVRALGVQTVLDDVAWLAALGGADDLLRTTRPSEQPLLIVLDSWGPTAGHIRVAERLRTLASATRDAAGHVWLLDRSTTGWLAAQARDPASGDGPFVGLFPAAADDDDLAGLTGQLLASASAPIDLVHVSLSVRLPTDNSAPVTLPRAGTATDRQVTWVAAGTGHRHVVRHTAVFRTGMVTAVLGSANASVSIERVLPAVRSSRQTNSVSVCVVSDPGAAAPCVFTPRPSPTGAGTPTPSPPPTATQDATRTTRAGATLTAVATRTAAHARITPDAFGRLWLPVAVRGELGAERSAAISGRRRSAAAPRQHPTATANPATPVPSSVPPQIERFSIIGQLPRCDAQNTLRASADIVRVGEPLTLTLSVGIRCPQALDDRAVVLIVGGFMPTLAADVRSALHRTADAIAAASGNRLTLLDVAAPNAPLEWASSPDEYRAVHARIDALLPHNAAPSADWQAVLRTAEDAVAHAGPRRQPLVLVFDGAGARSEQAEVTARTLRLATAVRDATGHCLLVDLSIGGWLFRSLPGLDPTSASLVVLSAAGSRGGSIEGLMRIVLATFAAPLERIDAHILLLQGLEEAPVASPPARRVSGHEVHWQLPAEGHTVRLDLTLRTGSSVPARQGAPAFVTSGRRDTAQQDGPSVTAITEFCFALPAPAPLECPPVDEPIILPTPTPFSVPTQPPFVLRARVWLPVALGRWRAAY